MISRILEQWDALEFLFQGEARTDKIDGAAQIYKLMVTPGTKHMLLFLSYVIGKVDQMNLEFRSQYFRLSKLHSVLSDEYRSILGMFVREEIILSQRLNDIDPSDSAVYKEVI